MLKAVDCCRKVCNISRNISILSVLRSDEPVKKPKRKVSETVELVTLVDQNDKILGLKTKPETEILARKLNLSLLRVTDTKYGKIYPAYKLMSTSEMLSQEKKTTNAKTLKKLPLNVRITDNDLKIKIQTVKKWLTKNCEVHIAISRNNERRELAKSLFKKIQEDLKDESRIIDIRDKDDALRFIILPPKKTFTTTKKTDKQENIQHEEQADNIT